MEDFYKHPLALVEGKVGRGTRVWPWAHVAKGAIVGEDCNICEHVFIEDGAVIGDRVTIKCGVSVWKGVIIESDVFVGPGVAFSNDPCPRSREWLDEPHPTRICQGASLGANAAILCDVVVGLYAVVGAGAIVTKDVPNHRTVVGNPARLL